VIVFPFIACAGAAMAIALIQTLRLRELRDKHDERGRKIDTLNDKVEREKGINAALEARLKECRHERACLLASIGAVKEIINESEAARG
jgi:hypothetical protein